LNQQSSEGAGPCYVSVEKTGKFLLVANYGQGSAAMLPIQPDGRLAPASDVIQHRGSGIDPGRQEGPHLHSILPDPANRYAFAQDLGIDKVMIYRMDLERGKLALHSETPVKPGAGPRHFVFHPTGGFAYLINELDSTIIAYAWDADRGALKELQTANALPDGFKGQSTCADIHVSQSGRFLYGSNRGHDSIVIYAIDERTGALKLVGHEPTWGRTPRGFDIDPTGAFLLTANQESHTIVTFRIDKRTGKLALTDHVAEVPSPVCVKMVPYEELAKAAP
jgi:6-phosphogluconolactonase